MVEVITDARGYPVQPEQIDAQADFWQVFGDRATELSVRWVIGLCQKRESGWAPFTRAEIEGHYREQTGNRDATFWFDGLLEHDLLGECDGQLRVTSKLVDRCYEAAPYDPEMCVRVGPEPVGEACLYC